ncbi:MAG: earP [Proteobacteria bacterium]|nr:earP [Pseudomonadota bacterium]
MRNHWDIFCSVVDNFGDIGVCWRLARQLAAEHGLAVRLWVDGLASLNLLCPSIDPTLDQQNAAGVQICRWPDCFPETAPADVVIEAFACELPTVYLQAMSRGSSPPVWVNLEYLSAESWVEGCHALASPHPTLPLKKTFFFPGFTKSTGGLLLEKGLFEQRDAFHTTLPASERLEVSLFCYDTAPVSALLDAWIKTGQPMRCRVAPGQPLAAVTNHLGGSGPWQLGHLLIEPIPFLTQADYDRLLWSCDLNFVRGEDSFVRAQWAAVPFVWQIYRQDDEAHHIKLGAFLQRYTEALAEPESKAVRNFFLAWNQGSEQMVQHWADFSAVRPTLVRYGKNWANQLAQNELTKNLVNFCRGKL